VTIAASSRGDTQTPLEFFAQAEDAYGRAAAVGGGEVEQWLSLAGATLHLRLAGPALLPLLRALAHLQAPATTGAPALTVRLWDSRTTGIDPPARPWAFEDYGGRGEVRGFGDDRIRIGFLMPHNTLSLYDRERERAVYRIASDRSIPDHEVGAPLRSILHWWASARGLQMAHAGAVGAGDAGVLLVGRGGSGKSTTALACLAAGLRYVADDYCLLGSETDPTVYSLYSSGKLHPHDVARLPFLRGHDGNRDRLPSEKAVFFLAERFAARLAERLAVRAIVIPHVTAADVPRLVRVSPAAGLAALAPSTIFQLPYAGGDVLATLGRLCKQVPCYRLELGRDLERVPEVIARLSRGSA
jgi:hypothetical protein